MKPLRVWWPTSPHPGNLGDILTPLLLQYYNCIEPIWTSVEKAELICVGSIIRFSRPGQKVLGSGLMRRADALDPRAEYLAVRGPVTRERVLECGGSCPPVLGDPALLLPDMCGKTVKKKHDVGIVPHYVDEQWARAAFPRTRVISPLRADPLDVVMEIRECREIYSSSLHGLIVAHAFGIPAAWVRFSDGLNGDDVKFEDYARSVGIVLEPYLTVHDADPIFATLPDLEPLREAFRCL